MNSFSNRLVKRFLHLSKWASRHGHTCFRVYQKDIPEFPAIVDWYDGRVVIWLFDRTRDDTPEKKSAFELDILEQLYEAFPDVYHRDIFVKRRGIQSGDGQYQKLGAQSVGGGCL